MTIGSNGSLYFSKLHVTNGTKGFFPYVVAIKNNGTYIEGEGGHLLHISLHHNPEKRDPSLSQCHMTIPKEIVSRVTMHGFSGRQYFKWKRRRATDRRFYQAARLIFPAIFAKEKFGAVSTSNEPMVSVPLLEKATNIEFWFGGSGKEALREYLETFGKPISIVELPNGEVAGINLTCDDSRDYSTYQVIDKFGSYTITGADGVVTEPAFQLFIGPFGENCYGVMHGSPRRV